MLRSVFYVFHNELFQFDGEPCCVYNCFKWVEFPCFESVLKTPEDKTKQQQPKNNNINNNNKSRRYKNCWDHIEIRACPMKKYVCFNSTCIWGQYTAQWVVIVLDSWSYEQRRKRRRRKKGREEKTVECILLWSSTSSVHEHVHCQTTLKSLWPTLKLKK